MGRGSDWSGTDDALNRPWRWEPDRGEELREGQREGRTLKSLRASVCRASEGRVVRGERRPSLLKLKASLVHTAHSGNTHTHR